MSGVFVAFWLALSSILGPSMVGASTVGSSTHASSTLGASRSTTPPAPNPVLTVISPVVTPVCANALLATVLLPALGVKLPPGTSTLTAPVAIVCGAIPQPDQEFTCPLDLTVQQNLTKVTERAIGEGLPLDIAPAQMVAGTGAALGDVAPSLVPVGSEIVDVLQCTAPTAPHVPARQPPAPGVNSTTTTTTVVTSAAPVSAGEPIVIEPVAGPAPSALAAPRVVTGPPVVATAPPAGYRTISRTVPRFRYPVLMIMPLLLLLLGAYLATALTRPAKA